MQVKVCISASDWEDLPRPLVPYHFTMSCDGAADLPQEERLLARRTFEFIEEEEGEEREEREERRRL